MRSQRKALLPLAESPDGLRNSHLVHLVTLHFHSVVLHLTASRHLQGSQFPLQEQDQVFIGQNLACSPLHPPLLAFLLYAQRSLVLLLPPWGLLHLQRICVQGGTEGTEKVVKLGDEFLSECKAQSPFLVCSQQPHHLEVYEGIVSLPFSRFFFG